MKMSEEDFYRFFGEIIDDVTALDKEWMIESLTLTEED